jgi:hypothetical protein
MEFHDEMTLGEARELLREKVEEGHRCPLCTQFAKVYRRKITASMGYMLIRIYRAGGDANFVYLPSLRDGNGAMDTTMTQYWGLIEEERARREDGGRAGWWRLTELGARFVCGQASVPKYARVYDGRRLGCAGESVTIHDALGEKFDYAELMGHSIVN